MYVLSLFFLSIVETFVIFTFLSFKSCWQFLQKFKPWSVSWFPRFLKEQTKNIQKVWICVNMYEIWKLQQRGKLFQQMTCILVFSSHKIIVIFILNSKRIFNPLKQSKMLCMTRWPCQYWDDWGHHAWGEDEFIKPINYMIRRRIKHAAAIVGSIKNVDVFNERQG